MLNLELARLIIAERRRATDEQVRIGRFRRALAEQAASSSATSTGPASAARPGAASQGSTRALGPSR